MEEGGLYLRIGRRVAVFAPSVARVALALPAAFTRWVQSRLFNQYTAVGLFLIGVLTVALWFPISGIRELYLRGPSNKDVFDFALTSWASIMQWMGQSNQFDLLWVIFGVVFVIAIVPWLLKFYLWIVFSSLGFVIWWLVWLLSGYDLSTIEDPSKTSEPAASKDTTQASNELQPPVSPQADVVEEKFLAPSAVATEGAPPAVDTQLSSASVSSPEALVGMSGTLRLLDANHSEMKARIQSLLSDLRGRQETNLGLGMLFSIVGVVILAGLVFYGTHTSSNDKTEFLLWFIPRLSIVIFIQVFAYFFLGLYRGNLLDIKYFNNELTNIEYKRMGSEVALLEGNSKNPLIPQLCIELLNVERNFVLKKGESAVESRESKENVVSLDWKQATDAIKTLTEAIEKKSG